MTVGITSESPSTVSPSRRLRPVPGAALLLGIAGLVFLLFARRFNELFHLWRSDDTYSHGFLVPLVSAYLAWRWLRVAGGPQAGEPGRGLLWLLSGGLLHLAAVVVWLPPLDWLALTAILHGLAVAMGGRDWARGLWFPILFLFFLFPLPAALTDRAAVWLQGVVAGLAASLLQLFLPIYREGPFLYLPGNEQVEVGEACSGLRQLLAFVALSAVIAHLSRRGWAFKIALALSALPVAVAANVLRVLLMTLVLRGLGLGAIEGAYHTAWGLLTMVLGLFLFLGVAAWLRRLFPWEAERKPSIPVIAPDHWRESFAMKRNLIIVSVALGVLLLVQVGLQAHLDAAPVTEPPEPRSPLAALPFTLGAWSCQDTAAGGVTELADETLQRACVLGEGPVAGLAAQVSLVYSREGRDRAHHPRICYLVAGYAEESSGRDTLWLAGRPAPIERFCFTRNGSRSYAYYWHYTLEPALLADQSFLQQWHERQTRRWPSITIQVLTAARTPEQLTAAAGLVQLLDGHLQPMLPPQAQMGSEVLPVRFVTAPRIGRAR